jgi:MarR family transcriptional regulator, transcriptional regulator for hemolysin
MKTGKDTIGFLLNDAARLMRKDFERRTRSLGLTRAQWQTLFHLARNEGCNQATLADLLDVEPITLARTIDRLELSGLVERRADPGDRRARLLFLGERAHPLLEELRALGAETREIALAGISDDDRTLLMTLLTKMRANLSGREAATAAA